MTMDKLTVKDIRKAVEQLRAVSDFEKWKSQFIREQLEMLYKTMQICNENLERMKEESDAKRL